MPHQDTGFVHYINGYELEETILRENRNNDLVTSLRIVVKQWQTASVGLNKALCRIVKSSVRMFVD